MHKPFGEIIESSLTHWRGQSWQWDYFPPFATLVSITSGELILLGIIYDVKTGSSDPSREPYPYQKSEEELKKEQPHIFSFLKTTFSCIPVGFIKQGQIKYQMPPLPPKIHAFVEQVPHTTAHAFFSDTRFLSYLWHTPAAQPIIDELILAIIDRLTAEHITAILEYYSLLSGNDYRRLKQLSHRIERIDHV